LQFFLQSYIINKFYYCMIHLAKKKWYWELNGYT
jgi:hypothetical protein